MCQSSLHFVEDLGIGRVASEIMIKLPGAVVVTGTCRQQIQTIRQDPQSRADVSIMILMVDLDPIQSMIMNESRKHLRWQHMLATATPGVGNDSKTTGLVH
jgi:hypothetical protein